MLKRVSEYFSYLCHHKTMSSVKPVVNIENVIGDKETSSELDSKSVENGIIKNDKIIDETKSLYGHVKLSKYAKKQIEKEKRKIRQQEKKRTRDFLEQYNDLGICKYFFQNHLRKVVPYPFVYKSYIKERWLGRSIVDVVKDEFHCDNWDLLISSGKVKVNDQSISPDYILKNQDILTTSLHRHEMPVLNDPIDVLFDTDDVLVVNKPASIPVHSCGRYHFNSLLYILAKERGLLNLRIIHRLDRMTSGLTIFGKNYDKATQLHAHISSREVEKEYLSLVEGEFPSNETVDCREPLGSISVRTGIQGVVPPGSTEMVGKEAWTSFHRVRYNPESNTSLVVCRPHMGRTHQIRVHLQYLGYPIVNDPLYNSPVWGPEKGAGGRYHKSLDQLVQDIETSYNAQSHLISDVIDSKAMKIDESDVPCKKSRVEVEPEDTGSSSSSCGEMSGFDPDCSQCRLKYADPSRESLTLYLHALKYKGPDWEYQAPWPVWAGTEKVTPTADN